MRWQSHMNKRKMPGCRWCFSILNMMERQSELRIWHGQRKSNLLTVAVLNKCQSENAASLFKSIRGLRLTVSGGRSPLLWGWGDFFFLTKVLSILIRWHRSKQLSLATVIKEYENMTIFVINFRNVQSKQNANSRSDQMCQLIWIWFDGEYEC